MGKCPFSFMHKQVREEPNLVERSKNRGVKLDMSEKSDVKGMVSMINLTEEDLRIIRQMREVIQPNIAKITEGFYSKILENPELSEIIDKNSTVERLSGTLDKHINGIFEAKFDDEYVKQRLNIAYVHYRIKLQPKWYIGAFQLLQSLIIEYAEDKLTSKDDAFLFANALTKVFNFEQQIVLDSFFKHYIDELEAENTVNKEVSVQIAQTSETLSALGEETNAYAEELRASGEEVVTSVHRMSEITNETQTYAQEGYEQIGVLTEKISEISTRAEELRVVFSELTTSSEEIQKVINSVKDVADQTNLLALNSAIEAARAGEHGRGFSVVAQEVKKLSEETKNLVGKITSLVTENKTHINSAEVTLDTVGDVITTGIAESDITKTSFDKIITSMGNSVSSIESVVYEVDRLVEGVQHLSKATETVAETAEGLTELSQRGE